MTLGLKWAGLKPVASVEISPVASATHKRNFPTCHHFCGDIQDFDSKSWLSQIDSPEIQVVSGGPPYPQLAESEYAPIEKAISDLPAYTPIPEINHEWTRHSPAYMERIAKVPPGGSLYESFFDAFKRQYPGLPSMTIKENHGGTHIHPYLNRFPRHTIILSYRKSRVSSATSMFRPTAIFTMAVSEGFRTPRSTPEI